MDTKYIFVTGGVISGLGKGVAAASIGHLLSYDYSVMPIKCDGYLNVDPGTMNPVEHGEVFVLDDGTEVDMDFGHYERFLRTSCSGRNNVTMGKVFSELREKERKGDFLGKTVQLIPHASNYIIDWWKSLVKKNQPDVVLIEIGGTVGDLENELYLEAARQLQRREGKDNVLFVHLTYVPIPGGVNEQKSKPTQQSVSLLMRRGIFPDMILCRGKEPITHAIQEKISSFCNLPDSHVFSAYDVDIIYKIPLIFHDQGLLNVVNKKLGLRARPDLSSWAFLIDELVHPKTKTKIAICGKYTALEDSYASVVEALTHAGAHLETDVSIEWVDTQAIENGTLSVESALEGVQGVVVPGGFGTRGVEGKLKIISYCRKNRLPLLGLCYGLQLAVIEYMRNVVGRKDAHTTEIDATTSTPVVDILPDKKNLSDIGGTLRLGAYEAHLIPQSLVHQLYEKSIVFERHRHRYEVNPFYLDDLRTAGLVLSGLSPDGSLVEFIELPVETHPFFVATQAHPELKSSLQKPAPLFFGLVQAAKHSSIVTTTFN